MRISSLLVAISLALAPAAARAQSDEPAFRPEAVKAHVDFLADDALEGRKAGTRGYDIAARYVATRFEALGLKPGGPNGGWYQRVPLAQFELDPARPATLMVGARKFANGGDVLIGATPRVGTGTQSVTADAVFAGYGLDEDYAGLDARGKLAVVLLGIPQGLSAAEAQTAAQQNQAKIAADHGAIGLIFLVTPESLAQMPWTTLAGYTLQSRFTWLGSDNAPPGVDPRIRTGAYVRGKAAAALFEGTPVNAERLMASLASPGARPKGFALPQRLTVARTSKVETLTSPNVIGLLPGSDPALANEYILLSAHLDHEGIDPALPGPDRIYNGAMDNAAGVATMLEAARAFVESGEPPKRPILFVALAAEEEGLLGSQYLAVHPVTGAGRIVADVNLDMPMLLYDFRDVVAFGAEHSTMGPIVEAAAAKMGVSLSPDPMPEENLFVRSDHYSFVEQGVPSVFLVTGFANGGEKAFRDFLANHYHQVSDQPDLPFDWRAGAKFAELNYRIAREIADGEQAPRWYEGDEYGDRFAPGQKRARPEE